MHPARSAVAPGALEIGQGPLPQFSGVMVLLQPLTGSAHCHPMADGCLSLSQIVPAFVGESSHRVGQLGVPLSGQSRELLSPQTANHHPSPPQ